MKMKIVLGGGRGQVPRRRLKLLVSNVKATMVEGRLSENVTVRAHHIDRFFTSFFTKLEVRRGGEHSLERGHPLHAALACNVLAHNDEALRVIAEIRHYLIECTSSD
jgi:hypothetical protein